MGTFKKLVRLAFCCWNLRYPIPEAWSSKKLRWYDVGPPKVLLLCASMSTLILFSVMYLITEILQSSQGKKFSLGFIHETIDSNWQFLTSHLSIKCKILFYFIKQYLAPIRFFNGSKSVALDVGNYLLFFNHVKNLQLWLLREQNICLKCCQHLKLLIQVICNL